MDSTPISYHSSDDSGCISGSFSNSIIYESTPVQETSKDYVPSRKRKYAQRLLPVKRLQDTIESVPTTPKFSSTLNESLVNNLEKCHIKNNVDQEDICKNNKYYTPETPEKRIVYYEDVKKSKTEFFHNFKLSEESPAKEAHDILYANIITNITKKTFTPIKFRDSSDKFSSPAKKCLFESSERLKNSQLLLQITSNPVIMSNVLKYLSQGDLYRLSSVSLQFKQAILLNTHAQAKYESFMKIHRENKENYKMTPPSSPEKIDSPPGSPSSFNEYFKMAKLLNEKQNLTKCPRCKKPSIVECNISQCQNHITCGYIYCLKCFSFSENGPEDFYDKCQSSALVRSTGRNLLSDMSNSSSHCSSSSHLYSIFHSPKYRKHEESSGFVSENDYTPNSVHVRKNLSQKLRSVRSTTRVFQLYNEIVPNPPSNKKKTSVIVTPVVSFENKRLSQEDPPSPPKIRNTSIGSRQSKKNLKRLL